LGRRIPFEVHDHALFLHTAHDAFAPLEPGWSSRTRIEIAISAARRRKRRERMIGLLAALAFVVTLVPPLGYWLHKNQLLVATSSSTDALVTGTH
jgi:hypothetical protein